MCGSATFTIVVSSTWSSVADITASVIRSRSVGLTSVVVGEGAALGGRFEAVRRSCSPPALAMPPAGGALLICAVSAAGRDQDAARQQVEQRLLRRVRPPACKPATSPMTEHDEVGIELARGRWNAFQRVAERELPVRLEAASAKARDAILE